MATCDECDYNDYPRRSKGSCALFWLCKECRQRTHGTAVVRQVIKRPLIEGKYVFPLAGMLWILVLIIVLV